MSRCAEAERCSANVDAELAATAARAVQPMEWIAAGLEILKLLADQID